MWLAGLLIASVIPNGSVLGQESGSETRPAARPTVGAIRWDGWWEGNPWEKNLSPKEWNSRLPFYAERKAGGGYAVVSDRQSVMDEEIQLAAKAGLDYWAFCYYHPDSWAEADRYNYGWKRYRQSRHRSKLGFAFLLQAGQHLGRKEKWPETCASLASIAREPGYVKVLKNPPLFYVFTVDAMEWWFGSAEKARQAIAVLAKACEKEQLGEPYLVAQVFSAQVGQNAVKNNGFHAIGAYSAPGSGEKREYTYPELAWWNRWYRDQFVATGCEVVPLANSGWDGRPRLPDPDLAKHYQGPWCAQPTPDELAVNVKEMVTWIGQNPKACPTQTGLIYAWNETDEGGWLVPTRSEGKSRLDALAKVLRPSLP